MIKEKRPATPSFPVVMAAGGIISLVTGIILSYTQIQYYISNSDLPTTETRAPFTVTFAFTGHVVSEKNTPITKPVVVTFAIYNDPERSDKSAVVWEDTVTLIPARDGAFMIVLGSNKPIPADILAKRHDLYLGAMIGQKDVLPKRQSIVATKPIRIITR